MPSSSRAGMDVIVTNNMASMDHREVNQLVRGKFGFNSGLLVTADDALLEAHQGGEAARRLLAMALASTWPDDGRSLDIGEAEGELDRLCERLVGATMAETAQRLRNRFRVDCDLESVLEEARAVSRSSNALAHERIRARWVGRGEVDADDLSAITECV